MLITADAAYPNDLTLDFLLEIICQNLNIELTSPTASQVVALLKRRAYLIVIDGLERRTSSLSETQRSEIRTFLGRASQGKSIIILAMRNADTGSGSGIVDMQYATTYRLPTLSMKAAVRLVDSISSAETELGTMRIRSKEQLSYLERIVVLLDQNPLAIRLVYSSENAKQDPKGLYWALLAGSVVLNDDTVSDSTFMTELRMMNLFQYLDVEKSTNLLARVYLPMSLATFWNIVPTDLRYYYWFLFLPLTKDVEGLSVHKTNPLMAFMYTEYQDQVQRSMDNLGYDKHFSATIDALRKVGAIEDALVTYTNGTFDKAYHINPVATLFLRTQWTAQFASSAATAYVKSTILQSQRYRLDRERYHTSEVFWDGQQQHPDHTLNDRIAAVLCSLESDLTQEIEQHRESFTDALIDSLTLRNWGDPRGAELGNSLAKIQILRLIYHAKTQKPTKMVLLYLATLANALAEGSDPDAEGPIRSFFELFDIWSKQGEEVISPLLDARLFDLWRAEAVIATEKTGPAAAKLLYERNLAKDPITPTNHDLYEGIRRVQARNLQEWVACTNTLRAQSFSPEDASSHNAAMLSLFSSFKPGRLIDLIQQSSHVAGIDQLTMADYYRDALDSEEEAVSKFGKLTQLILSQSMAQNYNEYLSEPSMAELFKVLAEDPAARPGKKKNLEPVHGSMQDIMLDIELGFRLHANDHTGAKILLHRKIALETSDRATNWRMLCDIHLALAQIAMKQQDWPTAKQHLDERLRWYGTNADAGLLADFHVDYSQVVLRMGWLSETARHMSLAMRYIEECEHSNKLRNWFAEMMDMPEDLHALIDGEMGSSGEAIEDLSPEPLTEEERKEASEGLTYAREWEETSRKASEAL